MATGRELGPQRSGVRGPSEESTAAGIYGVIVSSAVMAASHAESAVALCVAVVVTLVVYWAAERYARLVAERIHRGHKPSWAQVRHQLTDGWAIVTASTLPLAVLVVVRLLGTSLETAVLWALAVSTLLLTLAGWEIGRGGRLAPFERVATAAVAGAFGAVMVVLKALLH